MVCLSTVRYHNSHKMTFFSLITHLIVYYFKSISWPVMLLFISCNVIDGVSLALTPSILRAWSEAGGLHTWLYMTGYALSSLLSFAATGSVIWSVHYSAPNTGYCSQNARWKSNLFNLRSTIILIAPKAGKTLHNRLLRVVMG